MSEVLAAVVAAVLSWFFTRRQVEAEKTWEIRRIVYKELLQKLRAVRAIIQEREEASSGGGEHALAECIDRQGSSLGEAMSAVESFADENTLHLSAEMEAITRKLCQRHKQLVLSARARASYTSEQSMYREDIEEAFEKATRQAQDEIRLQPWTDFVWGKIKSRLAWGSRGSQSHQG